MPIRRNTPTSQAQRVGLQRQNMQAAASGAPIQLRDATLGGYVPGGPAYGAVRDGRQVLVQRGAAGTGANLAGSVNFAGQTLDPLTVGKDVMWVPRGGKPTEIERRYGIGASQTTATAPAPSPAPAAPGLGAPTAYGDPAARAREAEQRRMMQQYASKEYWETEQGKAMLSLGQQMTAPKDAKLADYYGAQRAVGIGSMDEILSGLASVDDRYKEGGDLRKWAQANQGLALREYNKRFPGGVSNDPSMGATQKGYENTVSTYEAHGAPQESVDAFMAEQQARGKAAFRDMEKYPLAGGTPEQTPPTTPVLQKTAPLVDSGLKGGVVGISALRGAPINNAISAMPDRDARQAIEADYGGGSTPGAFVDPATLPNTAFVGNGMDAEPTLTPAREQEVPGITAPFLEPHMIRNSNLRSDALLNRYLSGIRTA